MDTKAIEEQARKIKDIVIGPNNPLKMDPAYAEFTELFDTIGKNVIFGQVWSRETLPLKTRSLLMIAMLTALDKPDQLRVHIQGALNTGNSRAEISEVLLQAAFYCGFPAAGSAYRIARDVFRKIDANTGS